MCFNQREKCDKRSKSTNGETSSNLHRFPNFVYAEDIDIVFANETWLSNSVNSVEILHSEYAIFRNDREGRRGGGVISGIRTGQFKTIRKIAHNYDLEFILVQLTTMSNCEILICSCYRPPNAEKNWMESFEKFLNDICTRHSKIVLAGDFNLPRACWNSHENSKRANERTLIRILDDYFLEQINNFPTRGDNILDLVITSIPNKVNVCEMLRPSESEMSTDHNAIIFDLKTECIPLSRATRTVFDYGRADFDGLRERLDQRISDDDDINNEWSNWKSTFLAAVNDFVPVKRVKGRKSLP